MRIFLTVTLTLAAAASAVAAQGTQADFRWEKALQAGSRVRLHNLSGNVTVAAGASERVEVVGIRRGSARARDAVSLEVVETSDGIVVCPVYRDFDVECSEDGMRVNDHGRRSRDRDWDHASIDIHVRMPRTMRLSAGSVSGDVTVTGAEGEVRGSSVSGEVRLTRLRASSVRASSVSGDVLVAIDAFTGDGELRFSSVSGNVTAELPATTNADVTMRSVSGSLDTEFPVTLNGRVRRSSMEARIGEGGRELSVTTVSGNVRLRAVK